jgi:hypothetical protein
MNTKIPVQKLLPFLPLSRNISTNILYFFVSLVAYFLNVFLFLYCSSFAGQFYSAITSELLAHLAKYSATYFFVFPPHEICFRDYFIKLILYFRGLFVLLLLSWSMVLVLSVFLKPYQTVFVITIPLFLLGYLLNKRALLSR